MAGVNKVILVGNLGKDPDIMTFENGVKRAAISVATTESYKDKEGKWVDQTEWHNVVLWRWLAEKNLIKGDTVYIEGKLRTRSWDDKDGNKRYITEIIGDKVIKLTRKEQPGGYHPEGAPPPPEISEFESGQGEGPSDDLPF
jgi:single-strand DNA-binding protein